MCGRFAQNKPAADLKRHYNTVNAVECSASYNIAPTQPVAVLRAESNGPSCSMLRWGLVPHFTKDLKKATRPINARAETVASSGMFRGALASRRCIVPADAFYEW